MNPISPAPAHRRAIANWLLICAVLVALMVFVGGVTRLTESGLSIVEWKLLSGTLPPMSETAWQAEFDAYKATPQFLKVNRDFSLGDFQGIYWLEYVHRLLGRVIGLVIILPFAYFAARRRLPKALLWRGGGVCLLVAAQGAVGWVMVASGLVDEPRVAPMKLMLHLLLAFALFALLLWTRWQVKDSPRCTAPRNLVLLARALLFLLVIQIAFGALVAGLRAGLTYNTWPLMDGQFIPTGLHTLQPWWLNHVENVLTVQFQHRMGAVVVASTALVLALCAYRHREWRFLTLHLAGAVLVQVVLGVLTLLSVVNHWLASAHQLVALLLLASALRAVYTLRLDENQHARKKASLQPVG